jgi:sulfur carrier protein
VTIVLNGEPVDVPAELTLGDLALLRGWPERSVAVAVDGEVVPRSAWPVTAVPDGARVEVVTAMQGG